MSAAIGIEAQQIVREAAKPIAPGSTVKHQINAAWVALGRPPLWRVQAAWYGHADSWSAAAIRDLQDRFLRWREADARRAASHAETEAMRRAERTRVELEAARNEHRAQLARIERQLAACDHAFRIQHAHEDRP